jgi:hypothetical protein
MNTSRFYSKLRRTVHLFQTQCNQQIRVSIFKSEIRDRKSEVRDRKSEVRSQRSEVRDQRSEIRNLKSQILNLITQPQKAKDQRPKAKDQKPSISNTQRLHHFLNLFFQRCINEVVVFALVQIAFHTEIELYLWFSS